MVCTGPHFGGFGARAAQRAAIPWAAGVNSGHGIYEAAAGGNSARGDYVQCAVLVGAAGESGRAIPDGGRRDRSGFD